MNAFEMVRLCARHQLDPDDMAWTAYGRARGDVQYRYLREAHLGPNLYMENTFDRHGHGAGYRLLLPVLLLKAG